MAINEGNIKWRDRKGEDLIGIEQSLIRIWSDQLDDYRIGRVLSHFKGSTYLVNYITDPPTETTFEENLGLKSPTKWQIADPQPVSSGRRRRGAPVDYRETRGRQVARDDEGDAYVPPPTNMVVSDDEEETDSTPTSKKGSRSASKSKVKGKSKGRGYSVPAKSTKKKNEAKSVSDSEVARGDSDKEEVDCESNLAELLDSFRKLDVLSMSVRPRFRCDGSRDMLRIAAEQILSDSDHAGDLRIVAEMLTHTELAAAMELKVMYKDRPAGGFGDELGLWSTAVEELARKWAMEAFKLVTGVQVEGESDDVSREDTPQPAAKKARVSSLASQNMEAEEAAVPLEEAAHPVGVSPSMEPERGLSRMREELAKLSGALPYATALQPDASAITGASVLSYVAKLTHLKAEVCVSDTLHLLLSDETALEDAHRQGTTVFVVCGPPPPQGHLAFYHPGSQTEIGEIFRTYNGTFFEDVFLAFTSSLGGPAVEATNENLKVIFDIVATHLVDMLATLFKGRLDTHIMRKRV